MKEFDETKPIRDIIEAYTPHAPEFDSLFEGEVLGDEPLRQICQSKLMPFEAETLSFGQMFDGQTLGKAVPQKSMSPMWGFITAAACFALLFLLPDKLQIEKRSLNFVKHTEIHGLSGKTKSLHSDSQNHPVFTQKLESPKTIKALVINRKKITAQETLISYEESQMERDSSTHQNFTKIEPSSNSDLAVVYERSVEEAYAAARSIRKRSVKHEKMTFGANFNRANRLLSLVNTKSADAYSLQAIANNYTSGYSSLEGTSTSLLRNATVSRNAWETPENLSSSVLAEYGTVYSLPINMGLSVSFPLFRNFEIQTGLNYTYMFGSTSGVTSSTSSFNLKQELHYIGIPVKISLNFFKRGSFGLYAAFGGAIEKGLAGVQKSHVDGEDDWESSQKIYGFQPSLTGLLGISYQLNKTFNLYVEPGTSFFVSNDQPISSRTEEPFNFNLGIGLRYRVQ